MVRPVAIDRPASAYRCHIVPMLYATKGFAADWHDLESRAVESNAFLSPAFVQPAIDRLIQADELLAVAVRHADDRLVGLALFEKPAANRQMPYPHLRLFRSVHSFRSGLLIDKEQPGEILQALFEFLREQDYWGIEFCEQWLDSPVVTAIQSVCDNDKVRWQLRDECLRPSFTLPTDVAGGASASWSKSRKKAVQKSLKRLEQRGEASVEVVRDGWAFVEAREEFLRLEHAGWKSSLGSSLLSSPADASFFREMMSRFSQLGQAFFIELRCGSEVVASTANFSSGQTAFAFKVGWNPDLAPCSPGLLVDAMLLTESHRLLPGMTLVDSCAKPGSHLESIWPDKLRIGNALLTLRRRSRLVTSALDRTRIAKRLLTHSYAT